VDPETIATYEARSAEWIAARAPRALELAAALADDVAPGAWRADLGCGPGWYAPALGEPVVALDATAAMLAAVPEHAPDAVRVRADIEALPFRRHALGGAWANASYVHVAAELVPLALADLHRAVAPGGAVHLSVLPDRFGTPDPFGGRLFSYWGQQRLRDVVDGAGFTLDAFTERGDWFVLRLTRARTLADTVAPGMRLLVVGLNPSIYAADAGVGFARPGNRFWPAALEAGIVSRDRDARHALAHHGVGMTDLVKRATARADELDRSEYQAGAARVARLVEWLQPAAVCMVGLSGWRAAIDRRATTGWQPEPFGGRPVYVMPNTSGLNARVPLAALAGHLAAAAGGA
jgi:TDG/mug DNA glycosylase family protein